MVRSYIFNCLTPNWNFLVILVLVVGYFGFCLFCFLGGKVVLAGVLFCLLFQVRLFLCSLGPPITAQLNKLV